MRIRQGFEEKSRLGRLLIGRGYVTEQQLDEGLRLQRETGQRLGEIFIQSGWITEKELQRVLKHQSRYRNAAAVITVATLPFQPLLSFAASSPASASQSSAESGELYYRQSMLPMTDSELDQVLGQGNIVLVDQIETLADSASEDGVAVSADVIEGLKLTANIFVPVLNFLHSELTISGVHYREGEPRYAVRDDGGLTLAFPERIEEIRMDNIRVSGSNGPAFGNVSIQDIRFSPDSQMTIYTR